MHKTMEVQNEIVIKAIAAQTFEDNKPFGQAMSHLLFPKNQKALLYMDGHFILLLSNDADATNEIKNLIDLFSHIRYMENEHIIYVQNGENQDADYLLYEGCDDMRKLSILQGYDLGCGYELKTEQDVYFVCLNDGSKVLSQNVNIDFLAEEIKKYLEGRIFPTIAVNRLIKQNYLSDNDYNNQQALKISRNSILVALLIACISPLITLLLSNKWGKATINDTQFETILKNIGEKAISADTTVMRLQSMDTIQKNDKNEQDSIKPL